MYREWEVEQLDRADGHITMAERHVVTQRHLVEQLRAEGRDTREAERLLGTMERTLEAYQGHRRNIVDTIARIDAHSPQA